MGQYVNDQYEPIEGFKFPPHIANARIVKVDWDGGWGRSDWLITIQK